MTLVTVPSTSRTSPTLHRRSKTSSMLSGRHLYCHNTARMEMAATMTAATANRLALVFTGIASISQGCLERYRGHRSRADLVEAVVLPRPDAKNDLELRRCQHRLLVPEDVLDSDPRAGGVDPGIHAVAFQMLRAHEVHVEDVAFPTVRRQESLQLHRQGGPVLADLPRDDDPEHLGIGCARDGRVSLTQDPILHVLHRPRFAVRRVGDDDGVLARDRDPHRMEIPRPDVQEAVDPGLDVRGGGG